MFFVLFLFLGICNASLLKYEMQQQCKTENETQKPGNEM